MSLHENLKDAEGYLARMGASVCEKARIANYIPASASSILDVGCADGTITRILAEALPRTHFLGIDLDRSFIERAQVEHRDLSDRLSFEAVYLRDLLVRRERYDAITFVSVLHEFFSYGQGKSSILKALADAHEILRPGGEIVIRDMIPMSYARRNNSGAESAILKVCALPAYTVSLADFERTFGTV